MPVRFNVELSRLYSGTRLFCLLLLALLSLGIKVGFAQSRLNFAWDELPPLPDSEGFAGMYAGVSNGAVIVAGGANFPDGRPWEGGQKVWYDRIFVLEEPNGQWQVAQQTLPQPMAYGVSASFENEVIIAGGSDAEQHFRDVFSLEWRDSKIVITRLPDLPEPRANMAGAVVDGVLYLAGGTANPSATRAERSFWALPLTGEPAWQIAPSWPGPERTQPVAAAHKGQFYLFSGNQLQSETADDGTERAVRVLPFLRDAYRFTPSADIVGGEWQRLADLPRAAVAAASPAPAVGLAHLLLMGGVDTETARHTDMATYPAFRHDLLAYHIDSDQWVTLGKLPDGASRVTVPTTFWRGQWVIPSGEKKPGIRSPKVYSLKLHREFGLLNWGFLAAYLVGMLWMGFYFAKRGKATQDYFLAGRRIPWWAAGISIYGTQLSAITFMALPAIVFATNWALAIGTLMIIGVAPVVIYFFLPFFRRLNVTTAYEFLEWRYHVSVRWFGGIVYILFQCGRMGIVLFLPALAIAAVTGINLFLCIAIMGVICTIYTVMGGMEAVVWTDVLQVFVLLGGAILSILLIVLDVSGGIGAIFQMGYQDGKLALYNPGWSYSDYVLWVAVVGFFFLNLTPYISDQTVVQRYLTTKNETAARRSLWTNAWMTLITVAVFYTLGTCLYVFYKSNPQLLASPKADEVLPWFIVQNLPVGVAGIVIAGIFAATMSSLDSSMNSIAAVCVNDFYQKWRPKVSDGTQLRIARWITLFGGMLGTGSAIALATVKIQFLYDFFQEVLGLLGGSLAGVFILAVFSKRSNAPGVLIGALVGAALPWLIKRSDLDIHSYLFGAIGVLTCIIVGYLVSVLTGGESRAEAPTWFALRKGTFLMENEQ